MLTNPWGLRLGLIASAFTGVVAGPTVGWLRRRKRKSAEPWFRAENTVRHQKLTESLTPLQCRKVAAWPRRNWSGVQGHTGEVKAMERKGGRGGGRGTEEGVCGSLPKAKASGGEEKMLRMSQRAALAGRTGRLAGAGAA